VDSDSGEVTEWKDLRAADEGALSLRESEFRRKRQDLDDGA